MDEQHEQWYPDSDGDDENFEPKSRARIAELDTAIVADPQNASLYWQRGLAKLKLGNWVHDGPSDNEDPRPEGHRIIATGLDDMEQAIALDPTNVDYLKFHAKRCYWEGREQQAMADYERMIALAPDNYIYHYTLAEWRMMQLQVEPAIAEFSAVIDLLEGQSNGWEVTWPNWMQEDGMRSYGQGADEQERQERGSLANAYAARARCYYMTKQYGQAIADYTTLVEHGIDRAKFSGEPYAERARCYEALQQYEQALADYEMAEQRQPNANYSANKAKIYKKMGRTDDAVANYTAAIQQMEAHLAEMLNPPPPPPLTKEATLAQMSPQMRQTVETNPALFELFQQRASGLGSFAQAMGGNVGTRDYQDKIADNYRKRADEYLKLGRYAEAAADYSRAIELAQFQTRITDYLYRGDAYRKLKQYAPAIADYSTVIGQTADPQAARDRMLDTHQQTLQNMIEQMSARMGQMFGGNEMAQKSMEQMRQSMAGLPSASRQYLSTVAMPDYSDELVVATGNRGLCYALAGQLDAALADFTQVLVMKPNDAGTIFNIAAIHSRKHEATPALDYLRRALQLNPALRKNAQDPDEFGWLVENDAAFAAEFRKLVEQRN